MFALAALDYAVFHLDYSRPNTLYSYWIALSFVVIVFAVAIAYSYWIGVAHKPANTLVIPGIFATVILLLIAGVLDMFYFMFTKIRRIDELYTFDVWSAQYKWFGYWDWTLQILWSLTFIALMFAMWYFILKYKSKPKPNTNPKIQ